jgi:hypothetical protein
MQKPCCAKRCSYYCPRALSANSPATRTAKMPTVHAMSAEEHRHNAPESFAEAKEQILLRFPVLFREYLRSPSWPSRTRSNHEKSSVRIFESFPPPSLLGCLLKEYGAAHADASSSREIVFLLVCSVENLASSVAFRRSLKSHTPSCIYNGQPQVQRPLFCAVSTRNSWSRSTAKRQKESAPCLSKLMYCLVKQGVMTCVCRFV